ncbi:MAG: wax ester/triacylglycerol synthase family O-acyltransferase [Deltaproteobacteria bacterium]|nr:wax ester/triacylglycerol synthase family O-acyltransferase [Deltaproteobacteria bacterium]
MEQLPGADSAFLALETSDAPAHVGGLTILDASETSDFSFEKLVRTVGERVHLQPRLTRKLRELPLGIDRPYLVADPDFDVRNHIHRIAVASPGGLRDLAELVSYLHARPLHRDRPLWELWFIEGVEGGRHAMFMKSHHCLMDGAAGAGMGELLCDLEPNPPAGQLPPAAMARANQGEAESETTYGDFEIALRAAWNLAGGPRRMLGFGAGILRQVVGMLRLANEEGAPPLPFSAPTASFNADVGPRRAFSATTVSLEDVKTVKEHYGVTVNDVVLAITGGAIREYLSERDELPEESLVATIAVSKRVEGDDEVGNQITMVPCLWATDEPDPVERLKQIHRNAAVSKELSASHDADVVAGMGEAFPPGLTNLFMRTLAPKLATAMAPGNVVVSNVRGTPVPLYVAGARIETMYPLSLLASGQGLNVTVVSYMGKVDVGFIADPDLVEDVWALAEAVPRALAELVEAAEKESAMLAAGE